MQLLKPMTRVMGTMYHVMTVEVEQTEVVKAVVDPVSIEMMDLNLILCGEGQSAKATATGLDLKEFALERGQPRVVLEPSSPIGPVAVEGAA